MLFKAMIILPFCCLAVSCTTASGPPSGYEGEWNAHELLTRSVNAYGGPDAVLHFIDLSCSQDMGVFVNGTWHTGQAIFRFKQPDRLYSAVEIEGAGRKEVFFNGTSSGERINGRSTDRSVKRDLDRRIRQIMIHAFFLEEKALSPVLPPPEKVDGSLCARLSRTIGDETWRIWIDVDQYYIRKIRLLLPPGEGKEMGIAGQMTVEWRFKEFERHGLRLLPHLCETFINDRPFQQSRIEAFQMNKGLEDKDFLPESE